MYAIKKNQISEQPKEAVKANLITDISIKQLLDDVNNIRKNNNELSIDQ